MCVCPWLSLQDRVQTTDYIRESRGTHNRSSHIFHIPPVGDRSSRILQQYHMLFRGPGPVFTMTNEANIPECFRAIYSMNIYAAACTALSINIRPGHLGDPAPNVNGAQCVKPSKYAALYNPNKH